MNRYKTKNCPICYRDHNKQGIFCSKECGYKSPKRGLAKSKEQHLQWVNSLRESRQRFFDSKPFDELGFDGKRNRIIKEQENCCNVCKISTWRGFQITLEIDHKDGNRDNDSRENLEGLCPNCHSITDTWRGRNKPSKNGLNVVSDEYLLDCLRTTSNIRQGLLKAGIAAKGNNYGRAKRLLK